MIIFGWGRQTIKNLGPAFKLMCSHCNNENLFVLTKTMTWFTLFFIPIFPYKISYRLLCPICEYGFELDKKQIDEIRPLAETNQLLIDGKISKIEYQHKTAALNWAKENCNDDSRKMVSMQKTSDIDCKYCEKCDIEIMDSAKFCANCGNKNQDYVLNDLIR